MCRRVAEVAAHRLRFVWAARRASGEEWALRSFDCRHQDSRGSSGEDKLTPRGVRPRTPSSGSERFRSRVEAHAVGRGMAPFCRRRTIPGCPYAYRRCSARYYPRLMRGGRCWSGRRAARQERIGPCGVSSVGIRTAGNRPERTNSHRAASGRRRHLRAPDPLGARRWDHAPTRHGASSSSSDEPWLS